MEIDQQAWKRLTKRVALLEDVIENMTDWNTGLFACLRILSKRVGCSVGADPMCALICGPGSRPRVIPEGINPEDIPGFYLVSLATLEGESKVEFLRRQGVLSELRTMRQDRLTRKNKLPSPPVGGLSPI